MLCLCGRTREKAWRGHVAVGKSIGKSVLPCRLQAPLGSAKETNERLKSYRRRLEQSVDLELGLGREVSGGRGGG